MKIIFTASILSILSTSAMTQKVSYDMSEMERDAKALELFLQDRDDHKKHCPSLDWNQPAIDIYKKELKSQLPSDCKK